MVVLFALMGSERATAQHTLTLTGGTGVSTARFYPAEETKWMWWTDTYGISWRYYSDKPRFVGCVGVDLEYMERGFNFGYAYTSEMKDDKEIRHYQFYTRHVNSLMLPIVWQPHIYAANNHLRIFIEAAFVLSYNISSDYSYENDRFPAGKYEWKVPRDNRFGYGLSGGAGLAVLLGQVELGFKAKYNFGYSDLMKNRNKYYSNTTDGRENPFYYTPLRSPVDNISVMLTLGWRFNKRGFDAWYVVRPKKEPRMKTFNFS
ncbi:MAG: PorT family protein, partial [Alistipes sp.]|nr:PorT family protein [Alistipes sp.]